MKNVDKASRANARPFRALDENVHLAPPLPHHRSMRPWKFSTSERHPFSNLISTSDQRLSLDIDIWHMSAYNLKTSNRHVNANVISTSDQRHCSDIDVGVCRFTT